MALDSSEKPGHLLGIVYTIIISSPSSVVSANSILRLIFDSFLLVRPEATAFEWTYFLLAFLFFFSCCKISEIRRQITAKFCIMIGIVSSFKTRVKNFAVIAQCHSISALTSTSLASYYKVPSYHTYRKKYTLI